jgi:hypothetical protein
MNVQRTMDSLTRAGFAVRYFETTKEAADYLDGSIRGKSVGIGGSMTIEQMGLYDRLTEHNTVYWHWRRLARRSTFAPPTPSPRRANSSISTVAATASRRRCITTSGWCLW